MKILVTGFTPFNNAEENPSMLVLDALPDRIGHASIIKQVLPTEFKGSSEVLTNAVHKYMPDVVVSLGEAGGRDSITPETIAFNEDDAIIADNAGYQPRHESVQASGNNDYHSSLPVQEIVDALVEAGIPSKLSNDAGRYVCNHIMYESQYLIHTECPDMKAGFIHLPSNRAYQPNMPTLDLDTEIKGIEIALATIEKTFSQQNV